MNVEAVAKQLRYKHIPDYKEVMTYFLLSEESLEALRCSSEYKLPKEHVNLPGACFFQIAGSLVCSDLTVKISSMYLNKDYYLSRDKTVTLHKPIDEDYVFLERADLYLTVWMDDKSYILVYNEELKYFSLYEDEEDLSLIYNIDCIDFANRLYLYSNMITMSITGIK